MVFAVGTRRRSLPTVQLLTPLFFDFVLIHFSNLFRIIFAFFLEIHLEQRRVDETTIDEEEDEPFLRKSEDHCHRTLDQNHRSERSFCNRSGRFCRSSSIVNDVADSCTN